MLNRRNDFVVSGSSNAKAKADSSPGLNATGIRNDKFYFLRRKTVATLQGQRESTAKNACGISEVNHRQLQSALTSKSRLPTLRQAQGEKAAAIESGTKFYKLHRRIAATSTAPRTAQHTARRCSPANQYPAAALKQRIALVHPLVAAATLLKSWRNLMRHPAAA